MHGKKPPTFLKKQPCTSDKFWRTGFLFVLDHFSKNRLASQTEQGLEDKKSSSAIHKALTTSVFEHSYQFEFIFVHSSINASKQGA
jgi:hypothetical protein